MFHVPSGVKEKNKETDEEKLIKISRLLTAIKLTQIHTSKFISIHLRIFTFNYTLNMLM